MLERLTDLWVSAHHVVLPIATHPELELLEIEIDWVRGRVARDEPAPYLLEGVIGFLLLVFIVVIDGLGGGLGECGVE